jgi:hypothetical protein
VDHHVAVLVPARSESGQWVWWRVGRRRLAWRPGVQVLEFLQFADGPLAIAVGVPVLAWWLGAWVVALLATAVVWPVRAIRGRWPVVAYRPDGPHGSGWHCQWVEGRAAADAAAEKWAAEISRDGRPTER